MQKRLVRAPGAPGQRRAPPASWLEVETLAQVELTSEDPAHPIEAAFTAAANDRPDPTPA